jgi:hypothetical protein
MADVDWVISGFVRRATTSPRSRVQARIWRRGGTLGEES